MSNYNITLTKPKLTVKCANATMEKDLVVQVDESMLGGGTTAEPPYTSIITNSGSAYFGGNIPDENGILTADYIIAPGETITIKHYGLFTWYRDGYWSSSWGGQTYAPDTFGTRYCIQTGSTENVYTLSVSPSANSGGAS